ncbi:hypothetical protein [Bradyrhizobium sp. BRP22]|uniref:hypothetical protein n=1 Tax=Bradyrhizobium sp. BRP22 TaxID=2793821 RepID=UPI001CD24004|nr:hypothetical protein [Bradyrhizobium sp. BRP22]
MTGLLARTLTTKLTVSNSLDGDDIRALQNLPIRTRNLEALQVIVADGDRPAECCVLTEGFAFRSKTRSMGTGKWYRCIFRVKFPTCRASISRSWIMT